MQYKDGIDEATGNVVYKQYKANGEDENGEPIEAKGQVALINFNGANNIEQSSNRITVNGITMDLKSKGEFTVNVGTDVDGVYEKIKEFIDDYNELVEETNKLLGEEQFRSYKPLTAEQKKSMDKEDIKLWEEKLSLVYFVLMILYLELC